MLIDFVWLFSSADALRGYVVDVPVRGRGHDPLQVHQQGAAAAHRHAEQADCHWKRQKARERCSHRLDHCWILNAA